MTVYGSFGASICAAVGKIELNGLAAFLAAIPGLMLTINNTLLFEESSKWFWRKIRVCEGYRRKTIDQIEPPKSESSNSYSEEVIKLEEKWPAFGRSSE